MGRNLHLRLFVRQGHGSPLTHLPGEMCLRSLNFMSGTPEPLTYGITSIVNSIESPGRFIEPMTFMLGMNIPRGIGFHVRSGWWSRSAWNDRKPHPRLIREDLWRRIADIDFHTIPQKITMTGTECTESGVRVSITRDVL